MKGRLSWTNRSSTSFRFSQVWCTFNIGPVLQGSVYSHDHKAFEHQHRLPVQCSCIIVSVHRSAPPLGTSTMTRKWWLCATLSDSLDGSIEGHRGFDLRPWAPTRRSEPSAQISELKLIVEISDKRIDYLQSQVQYIDNRPRHMGRRGYRHVRYSSLSLQFTSLRSVLVEFDFAHSTANLEVRVCT